MSHRRVTAYRHSIINRMKRGQTVLCGLCGEQVFAHTTGKDRISAGGKGSLSIDHIIEVSKGGLDNWNNLQPTHIRCNFEKSYKPENPNGISKKGGIEKAMSDIETMHDGATFAYLMRPPRTVLMTIWKLLSSGV